jgi:hypothetical protein
MYIFIELCIALGRVIAGYIQDVIDGIKGFDV